MSLMIMMNRSIAISTGTYTMEMALIYALDHYTQMKEVC